MLPLVKSPCSATRGAAGGAAGDDGSGQADAELCRTKIVETAELVAKAGEHEQVCRPAGG